MGLGDAIHAALERAGITPARVTAWLGRPCGCAERQAKLNALGWWAARVIAGKSHAPAAEYAHLTAD